MKNPFNLIVPRDDEVMINEEFLKEAANKIKEQIKKRRLIVLEGDYGSGKSLYFKRLYSRLKTKKQLLSFTDSIVTVLEGKVAVKNKSLFIEHFDLLQGLDKPNLERLTNAIIRLVDKEMILVIACRKDSINILYKINPLIRSKVNRLKIPSLSFEEARELVLNRLNEARESKREDLDPFTTQEIRRVWQKSKGNPRLILLLLRPLYNQRMMVRE